MTKLALVIFVFVMGFGWGAASVAIPTARRLKDVIRAVVIIIKTLQDIAKLVSEDINTLKETCDEV